MKKLFKHTRTYIIQTVVIIAVVFVATCLYILIYTKFHKKSTNEKFAETKTTTTTTKTKTDKETDTETETEKEIEKESGATLLPSCQCPIQLPPAEWNDTRKTVQELVVKVNDMNSRLTPIETTFKSAESAESKQK